MQPTNAQQTPVQRCRGFQSTEIGSSNLLFISSLLVCVQRSQFLTRCKLATLFSAIEIWGECKRVSNHPPRSRPNTLPPVMTLLPTTTLRHMARMGSPSRSSLWMLQVGAGAVPRINAAGLYSTSRFLRTPASPFSREQIRRETIGTFSTRRPYSSQSQPQPQPPPPPKSKNKISFWPFALIIGLGTGSYILLVNRRKGKDMHLPQSLAAGSYRSCFAERNRDVG